MEFFDIFAPSNKDFSPDSDEKLGVAEIKEIEPVLLEPDISKFSPIGLRNLGNTCFLNSALQCLFFTTELSFPLAFSHFSHQVNKNAPSPSVQPPFISALNELFYRMWTEKDPGGGLDYRNFKYRLGRVDTRFSGYHQEDSQEALAVILDRIHEDQKLILKHSSGEKDVQNINVTEKSISSSDQDGWLKYSEREESLVKRLFHGQLRSTLTCPECEFESVTFDPFATLSLPLPTNQSVFKPDSLPPIDIRLFNDRITNANNAFLLFKKKSKEIEGIDESLLLCELDGHLVKRILTGINEATSKSRLFAYKKDDNSLLVSFKQPGSDFPYGFPIQIHFESLEDITVKAILVKCFALFEKVVTYRYADIKNFYRTISSKIIALSDSIFPNFTVNEHGAVKSTILEFHDTDDKLMKEFFGDDPNEFFDALILDKRGECGTEQDKASKSYRESCRLSDCLETFLAPETLDSGDTWRCDRCKRLVRATKKLDLWRLPPILIIHIKRFAYGSTSRSSFFSYFSYFGSSGGSKINTLVDFPLFDLDLSRFLPQGTSSNFTSTYDLFAVSRHFGSLYSGHYKAVAKCPISGLWCDADDESISFYKTNSDWISNTQSSGYIFFYRSKQ